MDNKKKPFPARMSELQKKIDQLCKEYDIELVPVLRSTPQSISVQVIFVDMQNPTEKERFFPSKENPNTPSGLLSN